MKNESGFTLIELLVAITIGILVVGFGSMALNDFNEKQKVESTRQELISNLRLARNYAITNQIPVNSSRDTDRVAITIDTNGLMTIGTQNSGNIDTGYTFFSKDVTPNNIFITKDKDIKFTVTDGRSINGTINIGVSGSDVVKNINIDESGLIYEQ
jgi:type IV fimbrial biogenesis protein FimT